MGRVRKDILNGWKEIAGYVCRDIRTVERWEKHRGLPVRRVPGAGRATVYALIPEVDEWLSSTRLDDPELPELVTVDHVLASSVMHTPVVPASRHPDSEATALASGYSSVDKPLSPTIATNPKSPLSTPAARPAYAPSPSRRFLRWRLAGGFAAAGAFALVCAAMWPLMVQARHGTIAGRFVHTDTEPARALAGVPYRSQVPGVDDLYLSGIYFNEQRNPDALQHSLDDFSAAISKDAKYAPAYAGLANTYNLLREYSRMPDEEAYPKAKEAAERAIALDPRLPQAHASLGFVAYFWSWDAVEADREFGIAIELEPSSALAHHWYGSVLAHEGRFGAAARELDTAQRLQPTSSAIRSTRALVWGMNGHREEAERQLHDILAEAPGATSPHGILATLSLLQPKDPQRYLLETKRAAELRHDTELAKYAGAGLRGFRAGDTNAMWTRMLDLETSLHPGRENRTYLMAKAEAELGCNDAALADLKSLVDRHNPTVVGLVIDPSFRPLHADPRFRQLMSTMGLPALQADHCSDCRKP